MAIEIGLVISRFVPRLRREPSPVLPTQPSIFSGLEGLLKRYGISPDSLDLNPESGTTSFETEDGEFVIFWKERTVVPPLKKYLPQNLL